MPSIDTSQVVSLLIAAAVAYFIGALPVADRLSRRRGVDIFNIGTGLAGSTNVRKNVGKLPGVIVFVADLAKGVVVVFGAQQILGIEGPMIVAPVAAAVVGQWNSVFSGFRGGDGLVTLGGATIFVFPEYAIGFFGVVVAAVVASLAQKLPYSSLLNIIAGYVAIILMTMMWNSEYFATALSMAGLGVVVLAHALYGHARRNRADDEDDDDIADLAGQRETG